MSPRFRTCGTAGDATLARVGTGAPRLFLLRMLQDGASDEVAGSLLDWAVSVKLVPLFDTDVVALEVIQDFVAA